MASIPRLGAALVASLLDRSKGAAWGVTRERFGSALQDCVASAFKERTPDAAELERFLNGLHLEDLALAVACTEGSTPAWEHLVATHRAGLQRAALAIDSHGAAADLADSLFTDLFGVGESGNARAPLLRYFHGRSRLSTWLRAVLTQRYIDRVRSTRRTEPLASDDGPAAHAAPAAIVDPRRGHDEEAMRTSLTAAIAALPPRDRLRLACYHGDGMTLAAIGRMLKEHEATVSRHLTRTRREIRDAVEARLTRDFGMDAGAIARCFQSVSEDAGTMEISELLGSQPDSALGKNALPDRSST